MAQNIFQSNHGIALDWDNDTGADVSAGDLVIMGDALTGTLAVALGDIAEDAEGVVMVNVGVELTSATGSTWAAGEALTWDADPGAFIAYTATPATGDVSGSARAMTTKEAGEVISRVWLTGVPGAIGQA